LGGGLGERPGIDTPTAVAAVAAAVAAAAAAAAAAVSKLLAVAAAAAAVHSAAAAMNPDAVAMRVAVFDRGRRLLRQSAVHTGRHSHKSHNGSI